MGAPLRGRMGGRAGVICPAGAARRERRTASAGRSPSTATAGPRAGGGHCGRRPPPLREPPLGADGCSRLEIVGAGPG